MLPSSEEPVGPRTGLFFVLSLFGCGQRFWPRGRGKPHWRKFELRTEEAAAGEASQAVPLIGPLSPFEILVLTKTIKKDILLSMRCGGLFFPPNPSVPARQAAISFAVQGGGAERVLDLDS